MYPWALYVPLRGEGQAHGHFSWKSIRFSVLPMTQRFQTTWLPIGITWGTLRARQVLLPPALLSPTKSLPPGPESIVVTVADLNAASRHWQGPGRKELSSLVEGQSGLLAPR